MPRCACVPRDPVPAGLEKLDQYSVQLESTLATARLGEGRSDLFERMRREGAVVSELPCGASPTRWRFLLRNRLIAAVSAATVVIEAGARSGSLNTANHALALERPLGAVPGPVTSVSSSGCHRLIRESGAALVASADDVMELVPAK